MTEKHPVVHPILHLNGTGRGDLLEQREAVYDALGAALHWLEKAAPNARDYYPEPGLFDKAVEQYRRRRRMLKDLQAEIQAEMDRLE